MNFKFKFTIIACIIPLISVLWGFFDKNISLFLNSLLTILCIGGLLVFDKKIRIFSSRTYAIVLIFILLSVFGGRALGAYEKLTYWDKTLHFLSGFILVIIGKQIYIKFKGNTTNKALRKTYSFFIAVSGAAFWEIFEFLCDKILGTSAQNNSLTDTMLDIILGTVSALFAIFI